MRTFGAFLLIFCAFLAAGTPAYSLVSVYAGQRNVYLDDPELLVNRPVNIQGLTGLAITNSAYTQPKGRFTLGLSGLGENSDSPDYSVAQGILTATYGATDRIEAGVRSKMIATNLGSSATRKTGAGDTDLLFKGRLTSQSEDLPAIALGLGVTLPTGNRDKGMSEVRHEGIRLMVIGAHENEMSDGTVLGLYAEGQIVLIDQFESRTGNPYADKFGVFNAGILLPITEENQLQVLFEYNLVTKRDVPNIFEQNSSALTPGLRYVTPNLNITAGVQFLTKDVQNFSNDLRYVATISYVF